MPVSRAIESDHGDVRSVYFHMVRSMQSSFSTLPCAFSRRASTVGTLGSGLHSGDLLMSVDVPPWLLDLSAEFAYAADIAGLSYRADAVVRGIAITVVSRIVALLAP